MMVVCSFYLIKTDYQQLSFSRTKTGTRFCKLHVNYKLVFKLAWMAVNVKWFWNQNMCPCSLCVGLPHTDACSLRFLCGQCTSRSLSQVRIIPLILFMKWKNKSIFQPLKLVFKFANVFMSMSSGIMTLF